MASILTGNSYREYGVTLLKIISYLQTSLQEFDGKNQCMLKQLFLLGLEIEKENGEKLHKKLARYFPQQTCLL